MRLSPVIGFFISLSIAAHASTIQLNPGEQVTLYPNVETTVICGQNSGGTSRFCVCDYDGLHSYYDLIVKVINNSTGKVISKSKIGSFNFQQQCLNALSQSPSCY